MSVIQKLFTYNLLMWLIQVYSCLTNDPRTLLLSFMVEQHAFILIFQIQSYIKT